MEDREDGEDDTVTRAAGGFSVGGGRRAGSAAGGGAAPSGEEPATTRLSNSLCRTLWCIYGRAAVGLLCGFKRRSGCCR